MKIAIVGSEEKYWTEEQKEKARNTIALIFVRNTLPRDLTMKELNWIENWRLEQFDFSSVTLISGHCPRGGVDIWAEEVARELGFTDEQMDIKKPQINQWNDQHLYMPGSDMPPGTLKGYRSRNIDIATDCDVLYCIEPYRDNREGYRRSGGIWTLEYAKKLGKDVHLVIVKEDLNGTDETNEDY